MIDGAATLARRLERFRAALPQVTPPAAIDARGDGRVAAGLAARLAAAVDGEVVTTDEGCIVRCEPPDRHLPVDRERLATLPGQPPADVPLVCLDTETTGLATAAGTAAFLIGLGWWVGDRFRQVQLLLPDHGEERALLTALEAAIPPDAWLVTYNGRGFDWPLLTTRYRLSRRAAPAHAGHLDLLPIVRRLYRHRMPDARLRTAEAELLGMHRVGDVEGWQIPGRYLEFLRGGPAEALAEVARHNDQDVRSLGWLLAHIERRLGDPAARAVAPPGDLAGLARAFTRERRLPEALDCLDAAADRPDEVRAPDRPATPPAPLVTSRVAARETLEDAPWWSPRRPADFGGPPTACPAVTVRVRQRAGRGRLDDGADRRRSRPPPAPPRQVRGRGRGLVGAGRRAGSHGRRRRDRAGQDPRASPARSGGGARGRQPGARRDRAPPPTGDGPSPRSRPTCCGASSGSDRGACQPSARRWTLALFDRLDLRVLARADRQADSFPGTADQDGSPIRDPGQADVLDRERAGGGREAKIRGPSGARPPDDRRSQHGGHQGRQERVAGAGRIGLPVRGGRPVADRALRRRRCRPGAACRPGRLR